MAYVLVLVKGGSDALLFLYALQGLGWASWLPQTLAGWSTSLHACLFSSTSGVQINTLPWNVLDFSKVTFSYGKAFPQKNAC